VQFIEQLHNS